MKTTTKKPHMREDQWQERITDLCDWHRLLWYHVTDSRKDKAGFPDLVIVGAKGTIFAELKSTTGKVSEKQREWHEKLRLSGAEAYIWRPEDWDQVQSVLRRISGG